MMRQFISLVILFIFITACNNNNGDIESTTGDQKRDILRTTVNTTNSAPESDSMTFKATDIKIEVTPSTIRKTNEILDSAVYTIFNDGDFTIQFSYGFWIEKLEEKDWKRVPFTTNAITLKPMLGLDPGQNYEFKLGLSHLFDQKNLGPGQYRLIKAVHKKGTKNKKIHLKANFQIY